MTAQTLSAWTISRRGKLIVIVSATALLLAGPLYAEDITTLTGAVYKNATISRAEPDGIVVLHSAGIVKIPFSELTPEYAKRFGYDPSKAANFAAEQAEGQRQLYLKMQEDRRIANARDAEISAKSAAEADAYSKRKAVSGFVLEARERGTGDSSYDTWKTDYGSYDRQTVQDKKIAIAVHDTGGSSALCAVDIYFVGKSLTANVHFIYGHESAVLNVQHGIEARTEIAAPAVNSRVLNLAALGEQYASGAAMEGWIATGKIEGQRFGLVASNGTVANDADRLIAEFEERAKTKQHKSR